MESDFALLGRYASTRDAQAFGELVRRYAGFVFGICRRVSGNEHDAEDAAQKCFLKLAQKAGSITTSLSGWLHVVATRESLDVLRGDARRRRHEISAAQEDSKHAEATWTMVASCVDEALQELPDELRDLLTLRYLQGHTQEEVARQQGVHRSSISKREKVGLEKLRSELKKAGIITTSSALAILLAENTATAAPATLVAALGKMAMAGIGVHTTAAGASVGLGSTASAAATFGALKSVIAVTVVVGGLMAGGLAIVQGKREVAPHPEPETQEVLSTNPKGNTVAKPEPLVPTGCVRVTSPYGLTHMIRKHEAEERLWAGENLYLSCPGGQRLVFTQERPWIHLSIDGGPRQLVGICLVAEEDVEVLRAALEEMPGPLTVGCSSLLIYQLSTLPHLEKIVSLSVVKEEEGPPLTDYSIALLSKFKSLSWLYLEGGAARDISALAKLPSLKELTLSRFNQLRDHSPLAEIQGLTSLTIRSWPENVDISVLAKLTNLTSLNLGFYQGNIESLSPLSQLSMLSKLSKLTICFRRPVDLSPLSALANLTELDLYYCSNVSDLSPLHKLKGLTRLALSGAATDNDLRIIVENNHQTLMSLNIGKDSKVSDLRPVSKLSNLVSLDISGQEISDLSPLAGLSKLNRLTLKNCPNVGSLDAIAGLKEMSRISLIGTRVSDLSPLRGFPNLIHLTLQNSAHISDFSPLGDLARIEELNLQNCRQITDLSPLGGASSLESLWIYDCRGLSDFSALKNLSQLKRLGIARVSDLSPLSGLNEIRSLRVSGIDFRSDIEISDLSPLSGMKKLRNLSLSSFRNITDLTPLVDLRELRSVRLSIRELEPDPEGIRNLLLNGVDVYIHGRYPVAEFWQRQPDLLRMQRLNQLGREFVELLDALGNDDVDKAQQLLNEDPWLANGVDESGRTPLLHADTMSAGMMALLLDKGANPNVSGENGHTPLHLTISLGDNNEDKTRLLLLYGANVDAKNNDGQTPYDRAIELGLPELTVLLQEHGATEGIYEFEKAIKDGNVAKCQQLLVLEPDLATARIENGQTAIHKASELGNIEIINILLDRGVPVDLMDKTGIQPVHLAVESGSKEVVSFLLNKGANINATVGFTMLMPLLPGSTPLHVAAEKNDVDMLKFLLDHGAKVGVWEQVRGQTPLHVAAERGNTETIEILLKAGIDINVRTKPSSLGFGEGQQETPLHCAVIRNREMAVALLLANGADPTLENKSFATPLQLAIDLGHTNIADLLRQHDAQE